MENSSSILVCGSLAIDQILMYSGKVKDHMPTRKSTSIYLNFRARGPSRSWGGCGGNAAHTMSLFHAPVKMSAYIGEDGSEYIERLRKLKIDVSEVIVQKGFNTPTGILLVDSQGDQILFFGESESLKKFSIPSMKGVSLTAVTAGIPRRSVAIMDASRAAGVRFVVDPGKFIMDISPQVLINGIRGADSLIFNEYERDLFVRRSARSWKKISTLVQVAVTTLGSGGARVEAKGIDERIPVAKPDRIVDPNGTGDAFFGGYCYARYCGFSPVWSARMGAVAASFAIESEGAQSHHFDLISFQKRLERNYGELERPFRNVHPH
jgi:adenosine kinase